MRRFQLFPVLILVSLTLYLVGIAAPTAYAKPLTTNCTSGCYAWLAWDGTTYGGSAAFEVAGAITFHTSHATFQRWAGFWGAAQGADGHGAIHVGEEVDAPYSGTCGGLYTVETEWWLVQAWDANNMLLTRCASK